MIHQHPTHGHLGVTLQVNSVLIIDIAVYICVWCFVYSMNGVLEFVDASDVTVMAQTEHFMATDVEWDSTGRYVVSAVSWWGHKVSLQTPCKWCRGRSKLNPKWYFIFSCLENLLNFLGDLFIGWQWLLDLVFPRASAAENSTGAILSVVMATTPSLLVVSRTDARKCLFWIYYWNQSNLYSIKHNLRRIYV